MKVPHILIAENNPAHQKLIQNSLGGNAHSFHIVTNANDAIAKIHENNLDLIVLDLSLPKKGAFEVLKEIQAIKFAHPIPVIVTTKPSDKKSDRLKAVELGATDFVRKPFDQQELIVRVSSLLKLKLFANDLESAQDVIVALAEAVDARDASTAQHSTRVSLYAGLLGKQMKLEGDELNSLKKGALFHDIGKIAIRDAVLFKPAGLTMEEFEEIKRHPKEGYHLIRRMKSLHDALPIIFHHHERLDGSGYPAGLANKDITLPVRIASVADVFDALTTNRPYREALTREEAFDLMRKEAKKGWWDLSLVDEFHSVLNEHSKN